MTGSFTEQVKPPKLTLPLTLMYILTFHNDISQSIVQLDPRVVKDFLQVRDNGSQYIKRFHFESVIFPLHGPVIPNSNSFCVGTIVHQVKTCSWRVNVTFFLSSNVSGAWWRKWSMIIQNVKVSPFLCLSVNLSVCLPTAPLVCLTVCLSVCQPPMVPLPQCLSLFSCQVPTQISSSQVAVI